MSSNSSFISSISNQLTLVLSSICVLHCLAVPVVIVFAPLIGSMFTHTMEWWLTVGILPLALIGFLPTWWKHKNRIRALQFVIAISAILIAQTVLHVDHHTMIEAQSSWLRADILGKTSLSLAGAFLLAWVTYQNNRHTHVCTNKNHVGHHH